MEVRMISEIGFSISEFFFFMLNHKLKVDVNGPLDNKY